MLSIGGGAMGCACEEVKETNASRTASVLCSFHQLCVSKPAHLGLGLVMYLTSDTDSNALAAHERATFIISGC